MYTGCIFPHNSRLPTGFNLKQRINTTYMNSIEMIHNIWYISHRQPIHFGCIMDYESTAESRTVLFLCRPQGRGAPKGNGLS